MKHVIFAAALTAALFSSARAAETLFSDDFEAGNFAKWTDINSATGHIQGVISTAQAHSPTQSAFLDQGGTAGTDRFVANLLHPVGAGHTARLVFWFYDPVVTGGGRTYGELRSYSGDAYATGTLEQLYAIGKNNSVTYPAEVFAGSKYHGRVAFGTPSGWFNLDLPGCPGRSVGWHEFKIEVTDTTANFYVDGILGRSVSRGAAGTVDCVIMGSGLSSSGNAAYYDDFLVQDIDPYTLTSSYAVIEGEEFSGDLASLTSSDDNRLGILSASDTLGCVVDYSGTTSVLVPTSVKFIFEGSAGREGLSQQLYMYNHITSSFQPVDGRVAPTSDTVIEITMTATAASFVGSGGEVVSRAEWRPINDEDPASDGWVLSTDQAKWLIQ